MPLCVFLDGGTYLLNYTTNQLVVLADLSLCNACLYVHLPQSILTIVAGVDVC